MEIERSSTFRPELSPFPHKQEEKYIIFPLFQTQEEGTSKLDSWECAIK